MNSSVSTTRAASGSSDSEGHRPGLPAFFREARRRRATVGWLVAILLAVLSVAAVEACALARLGEPVGRYWVPGARDPMEVRP
jgi:hypothetical protein